MYGNLCWSLRSSSTRVASLISPLFLGVALCGISPFLGVPSCRICPSKCQLWLIRNSAAPLGSVERSAMRGENPHVPPDPHGFDAAETLFPHRRTPMEISAGPFFRCAFSPILRARTDLGDTPLSKLAKKDGSLDARSEAERRQRLLVPLGCVKLPPLAIDLSIEPFRSDTKMLSFEPRLPEIGRGAFL
jgi:hypothetical protein